jgi:hypothetical protein
VSPGTSHQLHGAEGRSESATRDCTPHPAADHADVGGADKLCYGLAVGRVVAVVRHLESFDLADVLVKRADRPDIVFTPCPYFVIGEDTELLAHGRLSVTVMPTGSAMPVSLFTGAFTPMFCAFGTCVSTGT